MVVHLDRVGKSRSGFLDDGDVHPEETEYGRAVHCYAVASGTLQGDREETGEV